ncbi:Peroxidase 12 [Sesamum angolense]|uniref:peroxidase n=1 Tax=Sesamum angolense TaxID=2727404 RepID=A0AAE1WCS1_9LAMI|nr:Peroxidase 12 [Sesamum angolense]
MASAMSILVLVFTSVLLWPYFPFAEAQGGSQPIVSGLSWTYYDSSCPKLESIVRKQLKKVFKNDIGQAAGLLRLHFHDCFVQGCDSSVLLDGSASGPSEQAAPPNLSLRAEAFRIIDDLRRRVHDKCGRVVSCADILALAARDAVFLSGGPDYEVPLGRRDSLNFCTTTAATRTANLTANLSKCKHTHCSYSYSLATQELRHIRGIKRRGAVAYLSRYLNSMKPRFSLEEKFAVYMLMASGDRTAEKSWWTVQ